jgi:hypothetical protein
MPAFDPVTSERLAKLEELARRPGTAGEGAAARAAIARIRARLYPRPPPTSIVGLKLRLDRSCDRGSRGGCDRHGIVGKGHGPYRYSLRCARCGRHRGWIKAAAGDLLTAMHRDGRLTASPILRDAGIVP